jgi:hypothetical protein
MAGLDPAIHVLLVVALEDVMPDRGEPSDVVLRRLLAGHDEQKTDL